MHEKFESAGAGASWRALGLKTVGAPRCPKDLGVRAPTAPVLTHSLVVKIKILKIILIMAPNFKYRIVASTNTSRLVTCLG